MYVQNIILKLYEKKRRNTVVKKYGRTNWI